MFVHPSAAELKTGVDRFSRNLRHCLLRFTATSLPSNSSHLSPLVSFLEMLKKGLFAGHFYDLLGAGKFCAEIVAKISVDKHIKTPISKMCTCSGDGPFALSASQFYLAWRVV